MDKVKDALDLLGYRARDRVSGIEGIITSVCFDLYGCVQATLHTGIDKDGKPSDQFWYDISRLSVSTVVRIMEPPQWWEEVASPEKGPAEKPPPRAV